jgi:hypothetical protein
MRTPIEQTSPYQAKRRGTEQPPARPGPRLSSAARHGDRGDDDGGAGDDEPPPFPIFVRYRDLVKCRIVGNWTQLMRMIERGEFPPGRLLSPNKRAWTQAEINEWLASRPVERKIVSPRKRPRGRPRKHPPPVASEGART